MLFARTTSALDRLADALRRADATWHGSELPAWDELDESEQQQWRLVARRAVKAVLDEAALE
jgi:hypothetical protein